MDCHHVTCPHCEGSIIIHHGELNCRIFRHGAYRATMEPIPPHLPKDECDRLVLHDLIIGCGKPFRVNEDLIAIACDYI
jgi:hypothetical protein